MEDKNLEVFRNNHFEVTITDCDSKAEYEPIRLAAECVESHYLTGCVTLSVCDLKNALDCIANNFYLNKKVHVTHTLFSDDGKLKFMAFDADVYVKDVQFSSNCSTSDYGVVVIHLDSSRDSYKKMYQLIVE